MFFGVPKKIPRIGLWLPWIQMEKRSGGFNLNNKRKFKYECEVFCCFQCLKIQDGYKENKIM